jgi:hypothetical protein
LELAAPGAAKKIKKERRKERKRVSFRGVRGRE